jgi:hypothetical protein
VLSDDGRCCDPEPNTQQEHEEQAPVSTLLSLAAERMAAHLAPNAYTCTGGCVSYFVNQANVNSANRLTPTATHTQSAMTIPRFPGSPDTLILRPRTRIAPLVDPLAYTMFTT